MSRAREFFDSLKTIEDVEDLLLRREPERLHLDYKSTRDITGGFASKSVSQTISSFANADGGVVVYGVLTQKRDGKKDGLDDPVSIEVAPAGLFTQIKDWSAGRISPPIAGLEINTIANADSTKRVHVVHVAKSPLRPHQADDRRYWHRSHDGVLDMDHAHVELLFRTRLDQERGIMPLVTFRESECEARIDKGLFTLVNRGNGPALNVKVRVGELVVGSTGTLGIDVAWNVIVDTPRLPSWNSTFAFKPMEQKDVPLLIGYQDVAGARYAVTSMLVFDPAGPFPPAKGVFRVLPEVNVSRVG